MRRGIIVVGAMTFVALLSRSTGGVNAVAATAAGRSVASVPIAKNGGSEIRPFRVNVPEADVADLRRRIAGTRWPDKETVADQSQGAQLARLKPLVQYFQQLQPTRVNSCRPDFWSR